MSDRGRYDYDITTGKRGYGDRERNSGGGHGRDGDGIFGKSGSHGSDQDRDRNRGKDDGNDRRGGGGWTQQRENLGRDREDHRGHGAMHRDHDYQSGNRRDHGERMSSGWGGLAGEDIGRDRHGSSERTSRDRNGPEDHDRQTERNRGYGSDDRRDGLPIDETSRLIASNKVEGTAVYGRDGHRLGSIYNFMVDKLSGKVQYAVMGYGGMLGMGTRYYPLPWEILTYDTDEGGYRIQMTERDLKDAPSFDRDTESKFNRSYDEHVSGWYGLGRR